MEASAKYLCQAVKKEKTRLGKKAQRIDNLCTEFTVSDSTMTHTATAYIPPL